MDKNNQFNSMIVNYMDEFEKKLKMKTEMDKSCNNNIHPKANYSVFLFFFFNVLLQPKSKNTSMFETISFDDQKNKFNFNFEKI